MQLHRRRQCRETNEMLGLKRGQGRESERVLVVVVVVRVAVAGVLSEGRRDSRADEQTVRQSGSKATIGVAGAAE